MKVTSCVPVKSESLINIGDTYIVVSIGESEDEEKEINQSQQENELNNKEINENFTLNLKVYSGQLKIGPW